MRDRIVGQFYLLQATRSVGFVSPVYTLFLLRDLSFTQVGALSAFASFLVVAGEIPTGYVGDRVGRRASIAFSIALKATSLAGFVFVRSFAAYAVLYVPWALGMSFASGSVDAWLYDTLEERLDPEAFVDVRGRGEAVLRWTSVATMVGGGALYTVRPTSPFVASVVLNVLGLVVVFSLPKNRAYREAGSHVTMSETAAVVRGAISRPSLRSFVLYVGLFLAVVSASSTYVQPVAESLFESTTPTDLPLGIALGLLYAGFTGVSAVASQYAGPIAERLGRGRTVLAVSLATAALLVLPRVVIVAALPMFVALRASNAILLPVVNGTVNDAVGTAGRATVLSSVSMLIRLCKLPLAVGAGVLADAAGETTAVAALGALFLLAGGLLWLLGSAAEATDARPAASPASAGE